MMLSHETTAKLDSARTESNAILKQFSTLDPAQTGDIGLSQLLKRSKEWYKSIESAIQAARDGGVDAACSELSKDRNTMRQIWDEYQRYPELPPGSAYWSAHGAAKRATERLPKLLLRAWCDVTGSKACSHVGQSDEEKQALIMAWSGARARDYSEPCPNSRR